MSKKEKNLFILISNTYTGSKELPGVRQDRKNIISNMSWSKGVHKHFIKFNNRH